MSSLDLQLEIEPAAVRARHEKFGGFNNQETGTRLRALVADNATTAMASGWPLKAGGDLRRGARSQGGCRSRQETSARRLSDRAVVVGRGHRCSARDNRGDAGHCDRGARRPPDADDLLRALRAGRDRLHARRLRSRFAAAGDRSGTRQAGRDPEIDGAAARRRDPLVRDGHLPGSSLCANGRSSNWSVAETRPRGSLSIWVSPRSR